LFVVAWARVKKEPWTVSVGNMKWKKSNPVFPVANVAVSIEWYRRVFGFEPRVVNPPDDVPVYTVLP